MAVVTAVAVALRGQDWSVLATATSDREPAFFVLIAGLAFLANSISLLLVMVAWRALLSGLGERPGAAAAARIFFVSQFAKFVPGKVLGLVVSIQMGKAVGVASSRMLSAWLLTLVVTVLTGATLGLVAGPEVFGGAAAWLALAALPIAASLVRPDLVNRAAAAATRILRRPAPATKVSARGVRRAVMAQSLAWLLGGVHLWLVAVAVGAPPASSFLLCVGAFSLASVTGMFAVFTPEGIGVRELVLMVALGAALPLPVAGVAVLASRLIVTLSEVTTAGVGLLAAEAVRRHRRAGTRTDGPPEPADDSRGRPTRGEEEQQAAVSGVEPGRRRTS